MRVLSQARLRPHILQLPSSTLAAKFRPFALEVLAWAGVSSTASSRQRARAIVGWFAAHAVHPQPFLHPDSTTLNLTVLPAGQSWASFNATFGTTARTASDTAYWYTLYPNGIAMLEKLIGTTANDGTVSDDGMLTEYAPGQWRIRNFVDFRAVQCTLQCKMAQVVLAAIGIPATDISTVGHDPMMFYEIETGRWIYIDPTFGEMLLISEAFLSPLDLVEASINNENGSITGQHLPGASYIAVGYFNSPNYPMAGMSWMTVHTRPQWAGGLSARAPYRFGDLPSQSVYDRPSTIAELLPVLGVGVGGLALSGTTVEIRLHSNWLEHAAFQRSIDGGTSWEACAPVDYREQLSGQVTYRSLDAMGFAGTPAVVEV